MFFKFIVGVTNNQYNSSDRSLSLMSIFTGITGFNNQFIGVKLKEGRAHRTSDYMSFGGFDVSYVHFHLLLWNP